MVDLDLALVLGGEGIGSCDRIGELALSQTGPIDADSAYYLALRRQFELNYALSVNSSSCCRGSREHHR